MFKDPEVKAQVLRALRSGAYRQTQNVLCRPVAPGAYGYCCLGVMADVLKLGPWQYNSPDGGDEERHLTLLSTRARHGVEVMLSLQDEEALFVDDDDLRLKRCKVLRRMRDEGIFDNDGEEIQPQRCQQDLAFLNDHHVPFDIIANFIEECY